MNELKNTFNPILRFYQDADFVELEVKRILSKYPKFKASVMNSRLTSKQQLTLSGFLPINYNGKAFGIPLTISFTFEYPISAPEILCDIKEGMEIVKNHREVDENGIVKRVGKEWNPSSDLLMVLESLSISFGGSPPVRQSPKGARPATLPMTASMNGMTYSQYMFNGNNPYMSQYQKQTYQSRDTPIIPGNPMSQQTPQKQQYPQSAQSYQGMSTQYSMYQPGMSQYSRQVNPYVMQQYPQQQPIQQQQDRQQTKYSPYAQMPPMQKPQQYQSMQQQYAQQTQVQQPPSQSTQLSSQTNPYYVQPKAQQEQQTVQTPQNVQSLYGQRQYPPQSQYMQQNPFTQTPQQSPYYTQPQGSQMQGTTTQNIQNAQQELQQQIQQDPQMGPTNYYTQPKQGIREEVDPIQKTSEGYPMIAQMAVSKSQQQQDVQQHNDYNAQQNVQEVNQEQQEHPTQLQVQQQTVVVETTQPQVVVEQPVQEKVEENKVETSPQRINCPDGYNPDNEKTIVGFKQLLDKGLITQIAFETLVENYLNSKEHLMIIQEYINQKEKAEQEQIRIKKEKEEKEKQLKVEAKIKEVKTEILYATDFVDQTKNWINSHKQAKVVPQTLLTIDTPEKEIKLKTLKAKIKAEDDLIDQLVSAVSTKNMTLEDVLPKVNNISAEHFKDRVELASFN
ncbi:hypothetical protein EIN_064780 [Entamoeba invadens IP1]|uniref:UEV domain-containing protein n=1 Tax=Entamoeba invadens IP1 TaxID=370355 RepID=A0A0A1U025_ENTIV|nr:hypothetical protein EIN_064780 [Entamoeba invadens IP1]ELP84243.1 hypothetical protein EIN_064780 [Entamoeba invadens IP1]|eukprot:XP_004183589.1 hypothetical protein EIN_064780 [Entamoeba invadens IP1]